MIFYLFLALCQSILMKYGTMRLLETDKISATHFRNFSKPRKVGGDGRSTWLYIVAGRKWQQRGYPTKTEQARSDLSCVSAFLFLFVSQCYMFKCICVKVHVRCNYSSVSLSVQLAGVLIRLTFSWGKKYIFIRGDISAVIFQGSFTNHDIIGIVKECFT